MKEKNMAKFLSVCAILAALSIILGKYLAINIGTNIRFSLENLPILMAGIYLGPLAGGAVGLTADLLGCLLVGYAINPIITIASVMIGVIGGLGKIILKKNRLVSLSATVFSAHFIGSVLIKTLGLFVFYGSPFLPTAFLRLGIYLGIGTVEFLILLFLSKNRAFGKQMQKIRF